jgi:hypothetical protein
MSFETERRNRNQNRNQVSNGRRHVYFYVLLFLATAVGHNVWKMATPDTMSAQAQQVQQVQELAATANRLAP